jgi:hypothetical protein
MSFRIALEIGPTFTAIVQAEITEHAFIPQGVLFYHRRKQGRSQFPHDPSI